MFPLSIDQTLFPSSLNIFYVRLIYLWSLNNIYFPGYTLIILVASKTTVEISIFRIKCFSTRVGGERISI